MGHPEHGVEKIGDFQPINRHISETVRPCEIWSRLLLITNRKSYTGSRLPRNLMTLDDRER